MISIRDPHINYASSDCGEGRASPPAEEIAGWGLGAQVLLSDPQGVAENRGTLRSSIQIR
ncbi:hypothetical protein MES5069_360121 [Mesorhizobium escarrei]|uniref:Uncharacterized protein n=1 Tax=Mesorhizobium escarrei TaxID=666018 RepID=A0ABM9E1Z0_9HYPH|nr:hypothetical protein MES5069_360121 [Mesorhizobium escarrei]